MTSIVKRWEKIASDQLVGRKIVAVRYMTDEEATDFDWYDRPLVVALDNGLQFFASSDDEGNSAGSLFTSNDKQPTLPVIRVGEK